MIHICYNSGDRFQRKLKSEQTLPHSSVFDTIMRVFYYYIVPEI